MDVSNSKAAAVGADDDAPTLRVIDGRAKIKDSKIIKPILHSSKSK